MMPCQPPSYLVFTHSDVLLGFFGAANISLTNDELNKINSALATIKIVGERYPAHYGNRRKKIDNNVTTDEKMGKKNAFVSILPVNPSFN
jgi:hypothetical protein